MQNDRSVAVIDAGNTAVKLGIFQNGLLTDVQRIDTATFLKDPKNTLDQEYQAIVLSSVLSPEDTEKIIVALGNVLLVGADSRTGLEMAYESPLTLGIDRLCNAVAVRNLCSTTHAISIDVGTCIKFDVVSGNTYLGGSISPGIELRYRSLNDYTARLPLVSKKDPALLIGSSTKGSIHSGVINGMKAEINGMIALYCNELADLTFFITGGDSRFFDIEGKNNIFADENLTLKGLYYIYLANVH